MYPRDCVNFERKTRNSQNLKTFSVLQMLFTNLQGFSDTLKKYQKSFSMSFQKEIRKFIELLEIPKVFLRISKLPQGSQGVLRGFEESVFKGFQGFPKCISKNYVHVYHWLTAQLCICQYNMKELKNISICLGSS